MSDFYMVGENNKIAQTNFGDYVYFVQRSGTIYAYWRSAFSRFTTDLSNAKIMVSTSTDGALWTTPTQVYALPGYDVRPSGVVFNGTSFVMIATTSIAGDRVTRLLTSTDGLVYGYTGDIAWTETLAEPNDLVWDGTKYYMAATVWGGGAIPYLVSIKTSFNLSAWTSLGYSNQLSTVNCVQPRIAVNGSVVEVIFREGGINTYTEDDRILHATYSSLLGWSLTNVVAVATGNPSICVLPDGYAVSYLDPTLGVSQGSWAWLFYDGDQFYTRGTYTQGYLPGVASAMMPYLDGFAAIYSQVTEAGAVTSNVFFRAFHTTADDIIGARFPFETVATRYDDLSLDNFSMEISSGGLWVSLSDDRRFYVSAEDYGDKSQVHRRITAQSPFYEGTYLIHAVRENITESVTVGINGSSQNEVTENMLMLEEIVSQPSFRVRLTMGDHVETWSCQTADYSIQRGHINMHNVRAMMKLQIPRLPDVSYEVT